MKEYLWRYSDDNRNNSLWCNGVKAIDLLEGGILDQKGYV